MAKLEKLYINGASTRILQRTKIDDMEYKNQTFPNNLHIHIRACDAISSYHCPNSNSGSKTPKWDCILNCCADFPGKNAPD